MSLAGWQGYTLSALLFGLIVDCFEQRFMDTLTYCTHIRCASCGSWHAFLVMRRLLRDGRFG